MRTLCTRTGEVRNAFLMGAALLIFPGSAFAQEPSGEAILVALQKQISGVKDFSVMLDIVADVERVNAPPMHAKLFFKQPDKIHVESDGFAMLPREGIMLNFTRLSERYVATSSGFEDVEGKHCYRVELAPKNVNGTLRNMVILVDPFRWTAERVETFLPGGRTLTATFEHTRVGNAWLPEKLTVRFDPATPDTAEEPSPGTPDQPARRQPSRKGTITISYSEYRVNIGLSDEVFTKQSAQ